MLRSALTSLFALRLATSTVGPAPLPVERYCEGHEMQERFVADERRVIVAILGRRSGKTVGFAVKAVRSAQGGKPGFWVVYITRTRKNAKKQVWPWIKKILRESNIPHKVNESDLSVELEGAAGIMLGGADDIAEIEKYRGFALVGAIIDECGIYPSNLLETLIDEVIEPATIDTGGWMVFGGTPGYVLIGRWYELSGPHVKDAANCGVYRGNLRSNPHLRSDLPPEERAEAVEAFLEDVRKRNGWGEDHPTYVREWLGRWAQDDEALVFPLSANANDYRNDQQGPWGLPSTTPSGFPLAQSDWRVVLGIDVGQTSPSAYVVLATHPSLKRTFILHAEKHTGQLIHEMDALVRKLKRRFAVRWGGRETLPAVVIDAGGMGKQHAEELRRRWKLPNEAADKRDKASAISVTRDALRCGRLQLLVGDGASENPTKPLSDELHVLVWNDDRDDIEDGQEDHCTDAMLYGYRRIRDYTRHEPDPGPKRGTDAWFKQEEQRLLDAAKRKARKKKRSRGRRVA